MQKGRGYRATRTRLSWAGRSGRPSPGRRSDCPAGRGSSWAAGAAQEPGLAYPRPRFGYRRGGYLTTRAPPSEGRPQRRRPAASKTTPLPPQSSPSMSRLSSIGSEPQPMRVPSILPWARVRGLS
eukprot:scaffold37999_cov60-Phaeocystis_antarctica.AAC.11